MKSHTFRGKRYQIEYASEIGGVTDTDEDGPYTLLTLAGSDFHAFKFAYHESLHALRIPSEHLHDSDGDNNTDDGARFLWRFLRDMGTISNTGE